MFRISKQNVSELILHDDNCLISSWLELSVSRLSIRTLGSNAAGTNPYCVYIRLSVHGFQNQYVMKSLSYIGGNNGGRKLKYKPFIFQRYV